MIKYLSLLSVIFLMGNFMLAKIKARNVRKLKRLRLTLNF